MSNFGQIAHLCGHWAYNVTKVILEEDTTVSQRSHLCTASHDFRRRDFPLVAAPIVIKTNAWVAAEAFIGPGVTVGTGAVVGARTVLTRSVEPGLVVAGNPARVIDEWFAELAATPAGAGLAAPSVASVAAGSRP